MLTFSMWDVFFRKFIFVRFKSCLQSRMSRALAAAV